MSPYIIENRLKQLATLILITTVVSFIMQAQYTIGVKSKDEKQGINSANKSAITYKIISAPNNTWASRYDLKQHQ